MKLQLVQIGNSFGIRIPKTVLQQCQFKNSVKATVVNGTLILSPDNGPREGWEMAFKKMAKAGDDVLLDGGMSSSSLDKEEWEW